MLSITSGGKTISFLIGAGGAAIGNCENCVGCGALNTPGLGGCGGVIELS